MLLLGFVLSGLIFRFADHENKYPPLKLLAVFVIFLSFFSFHLFIGNIPCPNCKKKFFRNGIRLSQEVTKCIHCGEDMSDEDHIDPKDVIELPVTSKQQKFRKIFAVILFIIGLSLLIFHPEHGIMFHMGSSTMFSPISFMLVMPLLVLVGRAIRSKFKK